MKKVMLLLITIFAIYTLAACTEEPVENDAKVNVPDTTDTIEPGTLTCQTEEFTWVYVYDEEKLLSYSVNGILIEDGEDLDGFVMDYEGIVNLSGGIKIYIETTKTTTENMFEANCEIKTAS